MITCLRHVAKPACLPSLLQDYCTNNPDEICRIAACQSKVNEVRNVMVRCHSKERWTCIQPQPLKQFMAVACLLQRQQVCHVGELHMLCHCMGW